MRKVAVTYGDCFTPLGNLNRTWDGLMGGQKGIEPQTFGQFAGEYPLAVISEFHSDSGGHERCTEMLNLLCACILHFLKEPTVFVQQQKAVWMS